jgi:hypothetical protein
MIKITKNKSKTQHKIHSKMYIYIIIVYTVIWKQNQTISYWKTKNMKQNYTIVSMFFSIQTNL